MTHDAAVKGRPSGEGKELVRGCHPNFKVDSQREKEQEIEREGGKKGPKLIS